MAKEKYISLKEAAALSGYSPDYVGQLIRSGKLPGKQVFSHVAWMTTEVAVEAYLNQQKKGPVEGASTFHAKERLITEVLETSYKAVLWAALVLMVVFILLLIYVLSVTIDHRIDRAYVEKLEQQHP